MKNRPIANRIMSRQNKPIPPPISAFLFPELGVVEGAAPTGAPPTGAPAGFAAEAAGFAAPPEGGGGGGDAPPEGGGGGGEAG